jgi:hypothetical protein
MDDLGVRHGFYTTYNVTVFVRRTSCEGNQECITTSWCLYDKDKQAEEEEGNEGDSPS